MNPRPRRFGIASIAARSAAMAAGGLLVVLSTGISPAGAAAPPLVCPGGSYNLCIPTQGANEAVTGVAGDTVRAGYDFTIPGSSQPTKVAVFGAYEELTVSCADNSAPTQGTIRVAMPDYVATAPFASSNGYIPSGVQSDPATYQGSYVLPDICHGTTIDIGQPGNMLFAAQVFSDGSQPITFRSHYNNNSLSTSGSFSASVSVTPSPIASSSVAPVLGKRWALGGAAGLVILGVAVGGLTVVRRRTARTTVV